MEARYLPAATLSGAGGDWYDVFAVDSRRVAIVVGDVSGHGSATVARMAEVRNMLRALAHANVGGPARQLEIVDDAVDALHLTTVFYACLDLSRGEMVYTRAGHVPGVLRRTDRSVVILYHGWDTPLGVRQDEGRSEGRERIGPGDTIVLFTDGLIEAPDSDLLESIERLAADEVAPFSGDLKDLAGRLIRLRPDIAHRDDALVLVVRLAADSGLDVHGGEQSGDLEDADHRS
jgi:serine phosphatase RsbU (regulator of sigma subunit)